MRPPNLHSVAPDDGPPEIRDEEPAALLNDFLVAHGAWHLTLRTVAAGIALTVLAGIDLYAITHLMQLREMDAMGTLGSVTAGSMATASFTLVAFSLISALLARNNKWAFGAAAVLYLVILLLVAYLLAPSELPNFRSAWANYGGGNVFAESTADGEVPAWFLMVALTGYAFMYTLAGLAFCWMKLIVGRCLKLWHARSQAKKYLESEHEGRQTEEKASARAVLVNHFADTEVFSQSIGMILRRARAAYIEELENTVARNEVVLQDLKASKAEKDLAKDRRATAQNCMKTAQALTI
jgi:signal transduction histidine kinase